MSDKIKYALPGEEQRKEMAIITECWSQMTKLDTAARYRVANWLRAWIDAEAPDRATHGDLDF